MSTSDTPQPEARTIGILVNLTIRPTNGYDLQALYRYVKEAMEQQMLYGPPDGAELIDVTYGTDGRA